MSFRGQFFMSLDTTYICPEGEEGVRKFYEEAEQEVQRDTPNDIQATELSEAQCWLHRFDA